MDGNQNFSLVWHLSSEKSKPLYFRFQSLAQHFKTGIVQKFLICGKLSFESFEHSVWKSQKKSHSKLRAKQIDKSSLKMPVSASLWKPEACS